MRLLLVGLVALATTASAADAYAKAGSAAAKKPKKIASTAKKKAPAIASPTEKGVAKPACGEASALQIAVADPARPLASVQGHTLTLVAGACCASFARVGATWTAVDALGRTVDELAVVAQDEDATCADVAFAPKTGKTGSGIAVRGAVSPQPSFAPTLAQRAALSKLVATIEKERVPARAWACVTMPLPVELRTIAFTIERPGGATERWAVVSGEVLVVARLEDDGTWSPKLVRTTVAPGPDGCHPQAYVARAVFDANGDGRPEIFVHEEVGDVSAELVFAFEGSELRQVPRS